MKKLLKSLAILLTTALVFSSVQEAVWAAPFPVRSVIDGGIAQKQQPYSLDTESIADNEYESPIVEEVVHLREEFAKHFRKTDGTFIATTYNKPVHVQDEEKNWIDIDATLSSEEVNGEAFFCCIGVTKSSQFSRKFCRGKTDFPQGGNPHNFLWRERFQRFLCF